jgi:Zn-dependent protease with chaperone function
MDHARPEEVVPGTPAQPDVPAAGPRRPLRLRRTVDATTMWQLALLLVVWAGGAALVALVAEIARSATGVEPLTAVLVWTAAGALVFVPPVEVFLGRVVLGLRRPTDAQLPMLDAAWAQVCVQAGIPGDRYVLRVQPSRWVNATAGAGHLVGVTTTALTLAPRQLEAILAHELGHHLGGHAMIGMLRAWYGWPLRLLVWLLGMVGRVTSVVAAIVRPFSGFGSFALLPVLLLLSCLTPLLALAIALPATASTIVTRRSELRADRTAVVLGYGAELLVLYASFAANEVPDPSFWRSLRSFLRDTHPTFGTRVRAIERLIGPEATGQ